MRQYIDLLKNIKDHGVRKSNRTGVDVLSIFGYQMRFRLSDGFPILTTKKLHVHSIIHELLWFLSGCTKTGYLKDKGVTIWDEWADENGDLGPVYGKQWRSWLCPDGRRIDQIKSVVNELKEDNTSRRLVISAWNPADLYRMAIPPCHCLFQFYVAEDKLSCHVYQRSADVFLGVPFNISSYALLTMMIAQEARLGLGDLVHSFGDVHIYLNHLDKVNEQITREPRSLPIMKLRKDVESVFEFVFSDFDLQGYDPYPHIKAEVNV